MPRKLIAIAGAATTMVALGTVAAQAMTSGASYAPRRVEALTPKVPFTRLATINGTTAQAVASTRAADGSLHLVFQTYAGTALSGLGSISIGPSGKASAQVAALSGWQAGQPGLVRMPDGSLEAVFGAISPSNVASVWGINSSNGGSSWSAPANVRGGGSLEALAYGSDITAALSSGTPVLALPQAGQLVVQRGLGAGSPSAQITNASDGSVGETELATDASTGEVVAGWDSIAGNPKDYLQGASPSIQPLQAVPGQSRNVQQLAGRDAGPGVFAPYTPDGKHVRLLRYGGGSVAVGSLKTTQAKALSVATSLDGRIWVMWGDDSGGGVAVTRSNKAVTRFEPIQRLKPNSAVLYRLSGDGRLGPLDLLVDQLPDVKGSIPPPGLYHGHTLAELSAAFSVKPIKNKKLVVIGHTLTVTVSDAGDPVAGAKVSTTAGSSKTNAKGVAQLKFGPKVTGKVNVTVTQPGYWALTRSVPV
jgi:hypothetical protein